MKKAKKNKKEVAQGNAGKGQMRRQDKKET